MRDKARSPYSIVTWQLWKGYRITLLVYGIIMLLLFAIAQILEMTGNLAKVELNGKELWVGVSFSPKIFMFVIGILLTPASLTAFVANGMTRKHFIGGTIRFIALMSGLFAVYVSLISIAGQLLPGTVGTEWGEDTVSIARGALAAFILFVGYTGCGWLTGSLFYRFHWLPAIVLCLFAYMPTILMEMVLDYDRLNANLKELLYVGTLPYLVKIALTLAVLAGVLALNARILRRVTIKRKLV